MTHTAEWTVDTTQPDTGGGPKGDSQKEMINNPGSSLERMANDTGGFSIRNTNDLGAGLVRVTEELERVLRDRLRATGPDSRRALPADPGQGQRDRA